MRMEWEGSVRTGCLSVGRDNKQNWPAYLAHLDEKVMNKQKWTAYDLEFDPKPREDEN
jgi:hypothetical protein